MKQEKKPGAQHHKQPPVGRAILPSPLTLPGAKAKFKVTIQAVIARAFFARSNLVLNRKNHALGDCFTRKKRSFAVTPLFRVDG
jgi:hypothetical protein